MNSIVKKVNKIQDELNGFFLERGEEIEILLNAIISKKHVFLLGVAGTGKSMLCRAVASHIEGAKFFDWLMTPYTVPDEVFGALDISKLENGIYKRITANKLPEAEFAFLDEIFKSNSSILNALLKITNERIYDNGTEQVAVPLISLFSASNELPDSNENLTALYDRLHFRKFVRPIAEQKNEERLIKLDSKYTGKTTITIGELNKLYGASRDTDYDGVMRELIKIFRTLKDAGITVSDRRKRECRDIIQTNALLNGHKEVIDEDLTILQHVLWDEPSEIQRVTSAVLQISNPFDEKAKEFMAIIDDLEAKAHKYSELTDDVYEIYNKFDNMSKTVNELLKQAKKVNKQGGNKPLRLLEGVNTRLDNILSDMRKEYWGIGRKEEE